MKKDPEDLHIVGARKKKPKCQKSSARLRRKPSEPGVHPNQNKVNTVGSRREPLQHKGGQNGRKHEHRWASMWMRSGTAGGRHRLDDHYVQGWWAPCARAQTRIQSIESFNCGLYAMA